MSFAPRRSMIVVWVLAVAFATVPHSLEARITLIDGAEQVAGLQGEECEQVLPKIGLRPDGSYLAAWWTDCEQLSLDGVWVRLFTPSGLPIPPPVQVSSARPLVGELAVAARPDGGFVVLWNQIQDDGFNLGAAVVFRMLDADGQPLGPAVRADDTGQSEIPARGALAMADDGRFLVVWSTEDEVRHRLFDPTGAPLGPSAVTLDAVPDLTFNRRDGSGYPAVVSNGSSFAVAWQQRRTSTQRSVISARIVDADGSAVGEQVVVSTEPELTHVLPQVSTAGGDDFRVAFASGGGQVGIRRLSPNGALAAEQTTIEFPVTFATSPRIAADGSGVALVVSTATGGGLAAQLIGANDTLLGPVFELAPPDPNDLINPAVTANVAGDFLVSWSGGSEISPSPFIPIFGDYEAFTQRLRRFCVDGDRVLCLGEGGRFEAQVDWRVPPFSDGSGTSFPLTSDTGTFHFFRPDNLELVVKIVDGRQVNGHFWVFWGSLTDVEFELVVTDRLSGDTFEVLNPDGRLESGNETRAFRDPVPLPLPNRVFGAPELSSFARRGGGPPPCGPGSPTELCLGGGRFLARVEWEDPRTGDSGVGFMSGLTEDTGLFWFFRPENLEIMVKVLDGRAVNGHFWVLFGMLSDLELSLTITDVVTGVTKVYESPPFEQTSAADVRAFPSN